MPLQWRNQIWQAWRKVPESDARSVGDKENLVSEETGGCDGRLHSLLSPRSTIVAYCKFTNSWLIAMNKSDVSGVWSSIPRPKESFFDHDILLKKLAIYLKNSSSVPFLKPYLHIRTQCVLVHGSYSSKESVKFCFGTFSF